MRIAILGATSQIAKDLVLSFSAQNSHELTLFSRSPESLEQWLASVFLSGRYTVAGFELFSVDACFDALINFVGVGNPTLAVAMGTSIFDVTLKYDDMALNYQQHHPYCKYLFLSSGATYGSSFENPADENTKAVVAINQLLPQDWYAIAKLHAECRHRSTPELPIIDIRVFNYFSRTQDISARFLMTDIVRAIKYGTVLKTTSDPIVRDFIHPSDFSQLVNKLLDASVVNTSVDCYSKAPVDKHTLLATMQEKFKLHYETAETAGEAIANATGKKLHYYSLSRRAANFGFLPTMTSLECVLKEASAMLD